MTPATSNGNMLQILLPHYMPTILVAAILYYLYTSYHAAGLSRYPGPLLAKFGKLWHGLDVLSNRHQLNLVDLHRKYGDVVRIGPKTLSIANPDYVPKVYGVSAGFRKSHMYDVFAPMVNGKLFTSLLSARDPKVHAELHKPMAKEFALSVVSEYEPLMDKTLQKWIDCLDERFSRQRGEVCDMAIWVRLYATESIMDVTFSESIGFFDAGGDVGDFMKELDQSIDHAGLLTTMPWTAKLYKQNPIIGLIQKDSTIFPSWAASRITKRLITRSSLPPPTNNPHQRDFLDRFLDASPTTDPPYYNFPLVMNWCLVNIMAGGDTTAIGLGAVVYYLLKTPTKHTKLVHELRSAPLIDKIISWKQCRTLPYLDACIREGFRLHPSIGLGLERDAAGLVMDDGYTLPAGTKVSMNAWVVNRQARVFGEDVDAFVPERWLRGEVESEVAFRERFIAMKRADLNFGAGARACTGRFVAFMETYKAVAMLFRVFDVSLVDPEEDWVTVNRWVTRLGNIRCVLERAVL